MGRLRGRPTPRLTRNNTAAISQQDRTSSPIVSYHVSRRSTTSNGRVKGPLRKRIQSNRPHTPGPTSGCLPLRFIGQSSTRLGTSITNYTHAGRTNEHLFVSNDCARKNRVPTRDSRAQLHEVSRRDRHRTCCVKAPGLQKCHLQFPDLRLTWGRGKGA